MHATTRHHASSHLRWLLLLSAWLLLPSGLLAQEQLCRLGFGAAGQISAVATAALGDARVVTAVRDGDGDLRLIVWDVLANGAIRRVGTPADTDRTATAGAISRLAITALGTSRVVTAVRDGAGKLRLIVWDVDQAGRVSRVGDSTPGFGTALAGAVRNVAITSLGEARVVTAVRDGDGKLRVIAWGVSENGFLTRLGTGTAGAIHEVAVVATSDRQVVTAVRGGGRRLKLIAWEIAADGQVLRQPPPDDGGGVIGEVAAAPVILSQAPGQDPLVVTALRDSDGDLMLISFLVSPDGAIQRRFKVQAGDASRVAIAALGRAVTTVFRSGGGPRCFKSHAVLGDGQLIERGFRCGRQREIRRIAITPLSRTRFVTASEVAGGILNLNAWEIGRTCP